MSYMPPADFLVGRQREGGGSIEFWWKGHPGERGAKVVRVDEHGMRWTLDIEHTHWVTQKVAAGLLKVSLMTVNKWVREGKFGATKLRRGVSVLSMRQVEHLGETRGLFAGR